ncbi:MAG: ComF family protein [Eudoraea sp.]|nr:ComF family protein [Eudoraea sp.]
MPLTEFNFKDENRLDKTFYGRIEVKKAACLFYYSENGIVKNLIHHLKYKNQPQIGDFLGEWFGNILKDDKALPTIHYVIPVPLHPKKLRQRGYNQVASFGSKIATLLQATFADDLLIKTRNSRTQTEKTRMFRMQHGNPLFAIRNEQILQGKNVLLVDDVVTTGATLEACTKALFKCNDVSVYIATMAMVP